MFDYGDLAQYQSNWQWCKERSKYHFDYSRRDDEGEWFQPLGQFVGDWVDEVNGAIKLSSPINWETRKFYGDDDNTVSPMIAQEEHDLAEAGADPKLELTNIFDNLSKFPTLQKIANFFELEDPKQRLHIQLTGQMFNWHIDKLWERCPEDPTRVVRITTMLTDWHPGQFYIYGTRHYSHWKAGDVHMFDWQNVPHATANTSHVARPTLQITGLRTAGTDRILKVASNTCLYHIT